MSLHDQLLDDDAEAWEVHADLLLDGGDQRGELVRAQAGPPQKHRDLPSSQLQLIETLGLLGPVNRTGHLWWRRGYWHGYSSSWTSRPEEWWDDRLGHESARFLRSLFLRWTPTGMLTRLLHRHTPPLERLKWLDGADVANLDPVFEALPRLRHLDQWRPGRFDQGPQAPLRSLSLNPARHPEVRASWVRLAEAGGLSELEEIELWGDSSDSWEWCARLLEGCRPRRVGFSGSLGGDLIPVLVRWRGFDTVEHLVLQGFWPEPAFLSQLIDALEARQNPLRSYVSTGLVPDDTLLHRLQAAVDTARISP